MYLIHVIGGLLFFLPIIALYLKKNLFNITNVAIIFAIEAIAVAVFEIPTGAIADLFGRKKTIVLALITCLCGLIFLYIGKNMLMFSIFALLNALAKSLISGTDSALIYDTLKDENKEHQYKKIFGIYHALWPLGAVIGSLVGGYLANFSLSLPILFTFIPISITLILSLFLKEPNYKKEDHKNIIKHIANSSKIILNDYHLILIFIAGFILWGIGESMHHLNSLFFSFKEIPIIYFGVISAFVFGFSSLGHYLSHHISEKIGNKKTLIMTTILSPILVIIATLTTKYTSAIFWAISSIFFGLRNPVINHLINLEVRSDKRATVTSSYNSLSRLGMAIIVPVIGYFAEIYTINTAFKISAMFVFIVPIIYFFIKNK